MHPSGTDPPGENRQGELAHLDLLPSESALVQEYGVSPDTASRAIAVPRDEGLVFSVPRRGTCDPSLTRQNCPHT